MAKSSKWNKKRKKNDPITKAQDKRKHETEKARKRHGKNKKVSSVKVKRGKVKDILLYELDKDQLSEVYKFAGNSAESIIKELNLNIGHRTLCKRLSQRGVSLSVFDKAVLASSLLDPMSSMKQRIEISKADFEFSLGDGFSISAMVEEALESDLDPSIFAEMSTRELPHAKNFIEWVYGREFLAARLLPRQVEMSMGFLEEYCGNPKCTDMVFIKDIHLSNAVGEDGLRRPWTISEIKERVTFLEHGVCPTCSMTYAEMVFDPSMPHCYPFEAASCMGQRCLSGDTLIPTSEGILSMAELLNKAQAQNGETGLPEPDTFVPFKNRIDIHNGYTETRTTDAYYAGVCDAIRISVSGGQSMTLTPNHTMMVIDENGKLKKRMVQDMRVSDPIVVRSGVNMWGNRTKLRTHRFLRHHNNDTTIKTPRHMTKDLARYMGWLTAEGTMTVRKRTLFATSDPEMYAGFKELSLSLFNKEAVLDRSSDESRRTNDPESLKSGSQGPAIGLAVHSTEIRDFLHRSCGMGHHRAPTKRMPRSIRTAPRDIVLSFLSGMYEGDGSIHIPEYTPSAYVRYSTTSRRLMQDLCAVLANLGVNAHANSYTAKPNAFCADPLPVWSIDAVGPDAVKLARLLTFRSKYRDRMKTRVLSEVSEYRGKNRVHGAASVISSAMRTNTEPVPKWFADSLKRWKARGTTGITIETVQKFLGQGFGFSKKVRSLLVGFVDGTYRTARIKEIRPLKKRKMYCINVPNKNTFVTGVAGGLWSGNSGKTVLASFIATYINHRMHMLQPTPQVFFGQDPAQKFTSMFTAIDLKQGGDTLWGMVLTRTKSAPWFNAFHAWLKSQGKKYGSDLFKIKETGIAHHSTLIQSILFAPNAEAMRGRTACFGGIDEIGLMPRGEHVKKANADECYASVNNSLSTLQGAGSSLLKRGKFPPIIINMAISSPKSLLDKIMSLVRSADSSPKSIAYHLPTWEVNPEQRFESDAMQARLRKDPEKFYRDFGARPPFALNPYHMNGELISSLPDSKRKSLFKPENKTFDVGMERFVYGLPLGYIPSRRIPRIMTMDAGESNNSFAIGLYSLDFSPPPAPMSYLTDQDLEVIQDMEDEDLRVIRESSEANRTKIRFKTKKGLVPYLSVDGLIEISPYREKESKRQVKVHFQRLYDYCIVPLLRAYNVIGVIADRWNITQIMQNITTEEQIPTFQYSLKWPDFEEFRKKLDSREIRLLGLEHPESDLHDRLEDLLRVSPALHMLFQLKTVRKVGRQIVKPPAGTDDLYRTMVLAHRFAFSPDAVLPDGTTFHDALKQRYMEGRQVGSSKRSVGSVILKRESAGSYKGSSDISAAHGAGYISSKGRRVGILPKKRNLGKAVKNLSLGGYIPKKRR